MATVVTFEAPLDDVKRVDELIRRYVSASERAYVVQLDEVPGRGAAVARLKELCRKHGTRCTYHVLSTEGDRSAADRLVAFGRERGVDELCLGITGERTSTGKQRVGAVAEALLRRADIDGELDVEDGVVRLRGLTFE
jgi:hypothetical protein